MLVYRSLHIVYTFPECICSKIGTYFIFAMTLSCYKIVLYFSLSVKLYRQGIACGFFPLHPHSKGVLRYVNLGESSSISKVL